MAAGAARRASRTAQQVALFRGLEHLRRDALVRDPLARHLVGRRYAVLLAAARVPVVRAGLERLVDRLQPAGPRASAVVRTRFIDDAVLAAVAGGTAQVVLLGAGLDARAHRLPALRATTVWEVDQPASQAAKRAGVARRVPAAGRRHVRLVPVDLDRDDLAAALRAAGFDAAARSVVVWEGVTDYLTAAAVDAVLAWFARGTAPGSRLVLTSMDARVPDGTGTWPGARQWRRAVERAGEPITFALHPDDAPAFVAARGLRLVQDLAATDLAARYLAPRGRTDPTPPFYRVAVVEHP